MSSRWDEWPDKLTRAEYTLWPANHSNSFQIILTKIGTTQNFLSSYQNRRPSREQVMDDELYTISGYGSKENKIHDLLTETTYFSVPGNVWTIICKKVVWLNKRDFFQLEWIGTRYKNYKEFLKHKAESAADIYLAIILYMHKKELIKKSCIRQKSYIKGNPIHQYVSHAFSLQMGTSKFRKDLQGSLVVDVVLHSAHSDSEI